MELKRTTLDLQIKQVGDDGGFEGYASTTAKDRGGDIVEIGAFDRSIAAHKAAGTMPKMLWQHDPGKVIGIWDEMRQDDKGLFVKGRCIKTTTLGKDAHELLRAGAIDSMSIGYATRDAEYEDGGETRRLKEVDLWEVSLVTFPMNEDARITAVKRVESVRDLERILREAGVPNDFAKLAARYGFDEAKARIDGRREGDDVAHDQAALADLMAAIKARKI